MPHVMIVDDDATIRNGLSELLELEGYRVSRAENGRASLNQLNAGVRPDVIVLDLEMPVMNGHCFLRELESSDRAGTPVVVVTGSSGTDKAIELRNSGLCDVFDKATQLGTVLDRIRDHCRI